MGPCKKSFHGTARTVETSTDFDVCRVNSMLFFAVFILQVVCSWGRNGATVHSHLPWQDDNQLVCSVLSSIQAELAHLRLYLPDHRGVEMAGNMLGKATSFWTVLVGVKVPKVTLYFWIIKVLCTTVGETFADLLVTNGGLGLETTTAIMFGILGIFLIIQFALTFYLAPLYWLVVVIVSTASTLVTDTMTDASNVPLWASSLGFTILLSCTFGSWCLSERTLAIHSIYTRRREAFYWLVILFTFGLGTAVGDWISQGAAVGYGNTVLLFAAAILVVALLWVFPRHTKVNKIACFWAAYILTRP